MLDMLERVDVMPKDKDIAKMTHKERMALLTRGLNRSAGVEVPDKILEVLRNDFLDVLGVRDMYARRHGVKAPAPALPDVPQARQLQGGSGKAKPGTLEGLIARYRTDPRAAYAQLRFRTRENYDALLRRISKDCGGEKLASIKAADFERMHDMWSDGGKKAAMGHALIAMMRGLLSFGAIKLEDPECIRLGFILSKLHFKMQEPRKEVLTKEQAAAVISTAHKMGLHSVALAQAFMWDCRIRQKDAIGEWVPTSDPGGDSDVVDTETGMKWIRGLRWSQIGRNLVLHHVTSKEGKDVEVDLNETPFLRAEFKRIGKLPTKGPVVICEKTELPYLLHTFRRTWRVVANEAGIPKNITNRDTPGPNEE